MIFFALRPQTLSVKGDGTYAIDSPGVKLPLKRRQQPRPPQEFSDAQRCHNNRLARRSKNFHCHLAFANQVKSVCRVALLEDVCARFESNIGGTTHHELGEFTVESLEKGMLPDDALKVFHSALLPGWPELLQ